MRELCYFDDKADWMDTDMNALNLVQIIEDSTTPDEADNTELFCKGQVDDSAVALWKKYSSGDASVSAIKSALDIRHMSIQSLEDQYRRVCTKKDLSFYLEKDEYSWVAMLSEICASYSNGRSTFQSFFSRMYDHCSTTGRAVLPFIQRLYQELHHTCLWNRNILLGACEAFLRYTEYLCEDVFRVSAKIHYSSEDISDCFFAESSGDDYDYIDWLYEEGIASVIQRYPVCFKLLCQTIQQYVVNLREMAARLNRDVPAIMSTFCNGEETGGIRDIEFIRSDFHNGCQSVAIIEFLNGVKIVYKPRSTAIDSAWNRFLSLLNNSVNGLSLKTLPVLTRTEYGYVGFVQQFNAPHVEKYYYHAGFLLCVCSIFGATDLHYENVIACGDSPVIVDLETIISPRPLSRFALIEADKLFNQTINVSRTLLLPRWVGTTIDGAREIGGFSSTNNGGKNYHVYDSLRTSADQYPADFSRGFTDAYEYFLTNRVTIRRFIEACGFDKCNYRYVFRRTALYFKLQRHFFHAAYLKHGFYYHAVTTRIGAGIILAFDTDNAKMLWHIERSEEQAIRTLDIPYFFCRGSHCSLYDCNGELIQGFLERSPIDTVMYNLSLMSRERLDYERNYIAKSLILSSCQSRSAKSTELVSYRNIIRIRQQDCVNSIPAEIDRIHNMLSEYSIDGLRFAYYAPVRDTRTTRYNLNILENTFYSGIWGVLMFHAAYACWKADISLHTQVVEKVEQLADDYIQGEDESCFLRLGMADGIAGVLRSIICISQILNEPTLLEKAVGIATRINEYYIARCDKNDLFGGLSGILYVLSQLYILTQRIELIPNIRNITEKLIGKVSLDPRTHCTIWKGGIEYAPLTGLAHGQAGYILALSLSHVVLKDVRLLEYIKQGMEYEERSYSQQDNNWFDYRKFFVARRDQDTSSTYQKRFMYGTCSGAPGIGITRIAIRRYIPSIQDVPIIDRVDAFCAGEQLVGCDNYCCGTMGWVDYLIESSLFSGNIELLAKAKEIASSVIPSISKENYILSNLKGIYDVSLFTGISGIGYEMIRTQLPEQIPSPLLFSAL